MRNAHDVLRIFNIIKEDVEDFILRAKSQEGKLPQEEYETLVLLSKQLQNLKVKLSNLKFKTQNTTLLDY
jgi:hypothetical protein|tara:strand:- start:197 stop:406 length:210 start_codon:yes stop_codon:yes gene_type:complete